MGARVDGARKPQPGLVCEVGRLLSSVYMHGLGWPGTQSVGDIGPVDVGYPCKTSHVDQGWVWLNRGRIQ